MEGWLIKLIIAEKPSVGRAIAAVLGAHERKDGYMQGGGYIVTWCVGHLVELAGADVYDARYSKWRREDLPIIPAQFRLTAPKDRAKQLKTIAALMARPDVDAVVNACDAGREGEHIFRLVVEHCRCKKPILRLWISSMEESAIAAGFAALRPGAEYENLYQAALCRSRADWLVGINATRLFSCLYGATLNVGRVQTPTLALLVEREAAITGFVPRPFYTVELNLDTFTARSEKLADKADAESIAAACAGQAATVADVEKQQKTAEPPKLYDLTTLQREANRLFGFTAQQALDYAQSLYEKKLLSYPRTDSQYITRDMKESAGATINYLQLHVPCAKGINFTPDMTRVINDAGVTDHHALIPTMALAKADLAALPAGERAVLELVAVRLLCATAPAHQYEAVAVTAECGGHAFKATGASVLAEGWKAIDTAFKAGRKSPGENAQGEASPKDAPLPSITKGQVFPNAAASLREGATSPPKRFTEDTLLSAMASAGQQCGAAPHSGFVGESIPESVEHKGLGTPATRAGIIEKLVRGGYVRRQQRQLVPTEKGLNLIAVLPEAVKSPALTAEWEEKLLHIERGQLDAAMFMEGIAALTHGLVQEHTAANPEYAGLFASAAYGEVVGICPRCGKTVRENKKGFACEDRACGFAMWKDDRFFAAKKKVLDKKAASALLKEGRVFMSGLYSEKAGKTYDAHILLADTGKYVNFKLDFKEGGKK